MICKLKHGSDEMVKEKPDSIRTYDEDGYKRRAACLCFRDEREEEVRFVFVVYNFVVCRSRLIRQSMFLANMFHSNTVFLREFIETASIECVENRPGEATNVQIASLLHVF